MKRIVLVTPGDPAGIGPEIVWKMIGGGHFPKDCQPLCIGAKEPFQKMGASILETNLEDVESKQPPQFDQPTLWFLSAPDGLPGFQAGWSIKTAVELIQKKISQALVTGPISKERLQQGGFAYNGHTEMLKELGGADSVTMMLANDKLRVALVTTHVSLKDVSKHLTPQKIKRAVRHTVDYLQNKEGITRPRIGIAGLNPHAGENGIFGQEELEVIGPTIQELRNDYGSRVEISEPLPSDTLFVHHLSGERSFDCVVCLYHDQGLIPVKLVDFQRTVNITLGLPFVRTSVDHGVGFDIAGKDIADPTSLISAAHLAQRLVK